MPNIFEEIKEKRAQSGVGTAVYVKKAGDTKYSLLLPLEKTPSFSSKQEEINISVTTSITTGVILGQKTLESKEVDFFYHRDNIRRLNKFTGQLVDVLRLNADYTGEAVRGYITYSLQDAESGNAIKGTLKITPVEYLGVVDNAMPLLSPTVKFDSIVDATVTGDATSQTPIVINMTTSPSVATVTATSENENIATVTATDGEVTITPVAVGSTVIVIKATSSEYTDNETTVLINNV